MKLFSANSDNRNPQSSHAPDAQAPDLHAETIARKIAGWQQYLIDLSKRNRMLNYRETKRSTLRILEPGFTELFQRLAVKEESLMFQRPLDKDADFRAFAMLSLLENLECPITVHEGDIKTAGSLIERQKTLQNLKAKAKLARDEQGVNILYLSFGFLEWSERPGSDDPWQKAPLIMVPVELKQAAFGTPYILSRLDEDLTVNPTLQYKYATEFGVKLPYLNPDKPDLEAFMQAMQTLADMRGWKLIYEISLSLMSFAKLTMYHDLSNNRGRIIANPIIRAMCGDTAQVKDIPSQYRNFDFDSVPPNERWQIVNADSSQQEAITLSKAGVSFVLQGPPGTGKSQTIANIIAEAIAQGKKVLFVSEKAAALQVVHKRLAENGLADFCLPSHNHKANKREIRDLIAANLHLPHHRVKESVLEELDQLFGFRNELNQYARELHTEIAPLNLSIYSAYGYLAKHAAVPEIEFTIERPGEITNEFFHTMLYSVTYLAESLKRLGGRISANPWYNTKLTAVDQVMRSQIIAASNELDAKLLHILELLQEIDKRFDLATPPSWQGALSLLELMTAVTATQPFPPAWLDSELRDEMKAAALETQKNRAEYAALYQELLQDFKPAVLEFDLNDWLVRLNMTLDGLKAMSLDLGPDPALEIVAGLNLDWRAKELLERLKRIYHDYAHVAGSLGLSPGNNFADMLQLCDAIKAMMGAPPLERPWFEGDLTSRFEKIERAQQHRLNIAALTAELDSNWETEIYNFSHNAMLRRFKTDYTGFFKFLNKSYREDKRTIRAMARTVIKKLTDDAIIELLQTLKKLDEEKRLLKNGIDELDKLFGPGACNTEADLDVLEQSLKTVEKLKNIYGGRAPDTIIRVVCAKLDFGPTYAKLAEMSQTLSPESLINTKTSVSELFGEECAEAELHGHILPMLEQLLRHTGRLDSLYSEITDLSAREILPTKLLGLIATALGVQQMRRRVAEADAELKLTFRHLYQGPETDWDAVATELERIDNLSLVLESVRCETVFIQNLCDNVVTRRALNDMAQNLCGALNNTLPELTVFTGLFYDGSEMEGWDLSRLAQRFARCIQGFEQLDNLLAYHDAQKACGQKGLGEFVQRVDALDKHPDIYAAFQKGFYRQWLDAVLESRGAVFAFKRNLHEACVQRFSRLDKKQMEIAKYRIRDKVIGDLPFRNGFVTANDEMRVLKRELDKKQRLLPVRRLFESIPNLLLQLKPCLMMSPLSVSYFLEADSYIFDMVIFDEASQIFPHDAIGAIYRGNQVIIAGDSQQLPPTNFFSVSMGESETDDNTDNTTDDGEPDRIYYSILEKAANFLPQRTLSWHYRSRHEHLIAFSNREIYRNKLITFPAPEESAPHTGVELVYVPNGVYERGDKGCNYDEAKQCVELIREHLELHPERSLGIIAFGEKQQRAIMREVQQFRENHPQHEAFFAEDKDEEFFVKNLENVQGDERDTIIFSIGYGKDKYGKMSMNFGPLNRLGGERRLNVAISRAKYNVKLVSSILPHDIDLERTEALGVQLLRAYLDFAQNGPAALKPLTAVNYNAPADDFATAVADFLLAKGYKVQTNVGCSAYKIDIAVQHPLDPKRFVAGIECDGLTYIAARTARDRDHLRRTVLTGMGWQLHRVWSAEWFANFDIESARLTSFIDQVLQQACNPELAEITPAAIADVDITDTTVTITTEAETVTISETTSVAVEAEGDVISLTETVVSEIGPEDTVIALSETVTVAAADEIIPLTEASPTDETVSAETVIILPYPNEDAADEAVITLAEIVPDTAVIADTTPGGEAHIDGTVITVTDNIAIEPEQDTTASIAPEPEAVIELGPISIETTFSVTAADAEETVAPEVPEPQAAETAIPAETLEPIADPEPEPVTLTPLETPLEAVAPEHEAVILTGAPEDDVDLPKPKPVNIPTRLEEYVTETDAAIAALTDRKPGEALPEPSLTKTLASTPPPALTKDGDLAELPEAYAKFLAGTMPGDEAKPKVMPQFEAAPANETELTPPHTFEDASPAEISPAEIVAEPLSTVEETPEEPAQAEPLIVPDVTPEPAEESLGAEHFIETTPVEATPADPDNPYGFAYYQEADWAKAQLSPHSDKLTHLGEQILYVLKQEQPLHKELLCRRLVGVFNNQKVTSLVRSNVEKALTTKIAERIEIDADGFVTLAHFTDVIARVPHSNLERRAPEHISKREIAAAVPVIMQKTFGLKKNDLMGQIAGVFGYGRRNNKLNHSIDEVLTDMLTEGRLKMVEDNKMLLVRSNA